MLYLFNSAYRPNYLANVLNTLFFPGGVKNQYRYSLKRQVSKGFLSELRVGEAAIIVYIDRFHEAGYRFIPLRLGRVLSFEAKDDRLYIEVQLTEFVHCENPDQLQAELEARLGAKGLPKADMSNRKNEDDGLYVIQGESILEFKAKMTTSQQSWVETVNMLSQTQAFRNTEGGDVLFPRLEVSGRRWFKQTLLAGNRRGNLVVHKGEELELGLSYRFPRQGIDVTKVSAVNLRLDTEEFVPRVFALDISSIQENRKFHVRVGREATNSNIEIHIDDVTPLKLILPNSSIHLEVRERFWDGIRAYFWFALNAVGVGLQGFDIGDSDRAVYIKVGAAFVSALALYRLLKLGRIS